MISEQIKNEFFLELCQKHEEIENPYLDIINLKINKYFFTEKDSNSYYEVKYKFNLTSRIDEKIFKEVSRTKIFFHNEFIHIIRDKRISKLLE